MPRVQIHCYGCDARVPVGDDRMEADLREAGWTVSHGETYCHMCAAQRGLEHVNAAEPESGEEPAPTVTSPAPSLAPEYSIPIGESRLSRTLRLMRTSFSLLRRDPRLLLFPTVALVANIAIGGIALALAVGRAQGAANTRNALFIWGLVASFPATYVTIFCGVALAFMLGSHLDGKPMETSAAWKAAANRAAVIGAWTILVCTIGAVLRIAEQRLPRFLVAIIDLSFALLTVFAIPILAYEELGPIDTFNRSRTLLRNRWPEQIAGAIGIGIVGGVLLIPCVAAIVIGLIAGGTLGVLLIAVGVLSMFVLITAQTAAEQVFRVCLYRYAIGQGTAGPIPFATADLQRPFGRRRRRGNF
jgi:hypothetical protein